MNARMTMTGLALFGMLASSTAFAGTAVGTAKARGDYRPFWQSQGASGGVARSYSGRSYAYRAPAMSVLAAPVASAPMVAAAPTEARRFSYNPAAPAAPTATTGAPCTGGATAPATGGARRFSYDPSAGATVTPAPAVAPRVYSTRPSYSGRSRSDSSNLLPWQRLKTDPLKYTN